MSLEQWLANSWIKRLSPSAEDVGDLLAIADRELSDASLQGISIDGRYTHAYDAVRCLAEAALHASGYDVPKGSQQHERMIESLRFTVPANVPGNVDYFDRCRRLGIRRCTSGWACCNNATRTNCWPRRKGCASRSADGCAASTRTWWPSKVITSKQARRMRAKQEKARIAGLADSFGHIYGLPIEIRRKCCGEKKVLDI